MKHSMSPHTSIFCYIRTDFFERRTCLQQTLIEQRPWHNTSGVHASRNGGKWVKGGKLSKVLSDFRDWSGKINRYKAISWVKRQSRNKNKVPERRHRTAFRNKKWKKKQLKTNNEWLGHFHRLHSWMNIHASKVCSICNITGHSGRCICFQRLKNDCSTQHTDAISVSV